jgi:PAS domain S-box-containing protein
MDDSIRIVKSGWYKLFWALMVVMCLVVAVGSAAVYFIPSLHDMGARFALTPTAFFLSIGWLLYTFTIYWIIARRSLQLASFIGSMLFTLVMLYGLTLTDPHNGAWLYVGYWALWSISVSLYGLTYAIGTLILVTVYVLLQTEFSLDKMSSISIGILIANLLGSLTYLFWRTQFIDRQAAQVSKLSGMLRSNQEQSAILIQSISDGVIVTDTEGKVGIINPAAGVMTEWPVNEALGIDVNLVVKLSKETGEELSSTENPFALVLETKKRINQTLLLTGRNGSKETISLAVAPIVVPGGTPAGVVAIMRDVSEERAEEQQRAEFISTASHEMRTPVAAIEGYLALALNEKVSTIDSRARGYLEKAHSSTQHLGQLFQDLLTSAKAEDGRLSNHPTVVELGEFLEQLVEDLRFSAQKKGLLTEFVIGDGQSIDATSGTESKKVIRPLYYVYIDADRMREVITNLFDNAVKYTDQGKVTIGLTGNNDVSQLYIKDTGPGIPAADIPHLFQKFYRVDNSATRTIGGTGLGLFISRKIVELYQGRIWVESELGKGSAFFINLPRLDNQKAQAIQSQTVTPVVQPAR